MRSSERRILAQSSSTRRKSALTQQQVFRLLRCAIKDDEELVDEIIEQMYGNVIAFDYKRAECEIELIVQCSVTAKCAFRSLLKDMRTVGAPTALLASPLFTAKPEAYGDRVLAVSVVLTAVTLGEGRSMNIPSQISNALVTVSV